VQEISAPVGVDDGRLLADIIERHDIHHRERLGTRESNNDINTTCVPIDKRLALYHLIALENKLRVYHHLCSGQSDIGQTEGLTATNT